MGIWGSGYFENDQSLDFLATVFPWRKSSHRRLLKAFQEFVDCAEAAAAGRNAADVDSADIEALKPYFEAGDSAVTSLGLFERNPETGEILVVRRQVAVTCESHALVAVAAAAVVAAAFDPGRTPLPEHLRSKLPGNAASVVGGLLSVAIDCVSRARIVLQTNDEALRAHAAGLVDRLTGLETLLQSALGSGPPA